MNQLVLAGLINRKGKLVATSEDLVATLGELRRLRSDDKLKRNPKLKKMLQRFDDGALKAEVDRLAQVVQSEPLCGMRPKVRELQTQLDVLDKKSGKGLAQQLIAGVGHVLDDPNTLGIMLVGGAIGHRVSARLLRFSTTGPVYAQQLAEARLAGQLRHSGLFSPFMATAAVDGVAFHVGLNGFNYARGKGDEYATWGALDFLNSILLFQVLGATRFNALSRAPAVTALGKSAAGAAYFAEETAALSILGLVQAFVQQGNLEGARSIIQGNFEFLVALRMLGAAQRLNSSSVAASARAELQAHQRRASITAARYDVEPTRRNQARMLAEHQAFLMKQTAAVRQGYLAGT